ARLGRGIGVSSGSRQCGQVVERATYRALSETATGHIGARRLARCPGARPPSAASLAADSMVDSPRIRHRSAGMEIATARTDLAGPRRVRLERGGRVARRHLGARSVISVTRIVVDAW